MKSRCLICELVAAGVWWASSVAGFGGLALAPIGPAPGAAVGDSTDGVLVVYSAYKVNADFNARDPYRPEYSDYRILTVDGKSLRRVHNNSDTIFQNPATVDLPPGKYRVTARANGYGIVTVPIVIAAGEQTIVHLEGSVRWSPPTAFNQTNAVRLPDGQVAGWRAQ